VSGSRRQRTALASVVRGSGALLAPFVWDAASAQLAVAAGAKVVYMTGFGAAASNGYADLGLLNQTEVVAHAARIARAVDVPVLMDADDGYGSEMNLARTIELVEETRIAGLHIEDQPFPKTSNTLAGRALRSAEDMAQRIRTAVAVRVDPDLVIVGRTDAAGVAGEAEAFDRARRYADAGADAVFVTDLVAPGALDRYAEALPDVRKIWLGTPLTAAEMTDHGVVLSLLSAPMRVAWKAYLDAVAGLVGGPTGLSPVAALHAAQDVTRWQGYGADSR
jgi:2-methylisocitrate lyase-like PEP mutase family enzyme